MVLQEATIKKSTNEAAISTTNESKYGNKILVPANIAEAHETMAYSARLKAHALTTASWPVANARATVSNTTTIQ